MALLFMDGFAAGDHATKWTATVNTSVASSTPRVSGGYYASVNDTGFVRRVFTASSEIYIGFGMRPVPDITSGFALTIYGDSGATAHLELSRNVTTGLLQLKLGSNGTLIATGTTTISMSVWHYIEVRATIADAGGICQVRLDGSTTNEINFTGDTKNGGTSTNMDMFQLSSAFNSTNYYADVYLADTTGSTNNTWLGDVSVRTLAPTGDGTNSQLTGSDGNSVNNYQLVDELPFSAADYVGSPTSGLRDTYAMANLPAGATQVKAVQANMVAAKSDATAATAKAVLLINSTNYYGSNHVLTTSYQNYRDIFEANPDTTIAWTISDVNGLESGMEVV